MVQEQVEQDDPGCVAGAGRGRERADTPKKAARMVFQPVPLTGLDFLYQAI
jgi:hypothetical protein